MNPDGTGQTIISKTATADEFAPAWSPEGTKIAFSTNRDGNQEIYTMNADGSGKAPISHAGAPASGPDWQPLRSPPPPPRAVADRTAPRLKLRYAKRQRVSNVSVVVQSNEAGTVTARGFVARAGARKVYRFKSRSRSIRANAKTRLRLKLRPRALEATRRAVKHRKLKATITITAKDQSGNRTTARARIKLKP